MLYFGSRLALELVEGSAGMAGRVGILKNNEGTSANFQQQISSVCNLLLFG